MTTGVFVSEWLMRSDDWMGAAVCYPLQGYLSALHGLQTEVVESDLGECNHVWLKLPDGRALDPTADQFNYCNPEKMPPVYLGPPTKLHVSPTPPDTRG
jgi:hypothetical protein